MVGLKHGWFSTMERDSQSRAERRRRPISTGKGRLAAGWHSRVFSAPRIVQLTAIASRCIPTKRNSLRCVAREHDKPRFHKRDPHKINCSTRIYGGRDARRPFPPENPALLCLTHCTTIYFTATVITSF